jgi:DNA-binding beta-propeller fold protein YncE
MFRPTRRLKVLATPVLVLAIGAMAPARGDSGSYVPIATIQVPGAPLASFDISFADQATRRYFLADRSNKAVDIFDTKDNTFLGRVGGFVGFNAKAGSDVAGPNGVVSSGPHEVWAGDGDSTIKVINLKTMSVTDTIPTGGSKRADEMTYDPDDQLVAVANDADTPPFLTFISTEPGHAVLGKILFSDATNGLEQPIYDRQTKLLYVSVPQIGPQASNGAIRVIDPRNRTVLRDISVTNCQPAGLAQGPDQQLLAGCSITPTAGGAPANTQIVSALSGKLVAQLDGIGGNDEVWYNRGNQLYFLAARNNPSGAALGIVRAWDNQLIQTIPTATSAHSVAADAKNNHVFVPLGPSKTDASCTNGCIKVYGPKEEQFDESVDNLVAQRDNNDQ